MGRNPAFRATTSASRDNQVSAASQTGGGIGTASLKSALLDCECTLNTENTTASPAYEAKGWTTDFVLLSKPAPAPAPAYSEKPSSLVDLATPVQDVKTAPEEFSKEKEVPFVVESLDLAQPTGVDDLSEPSDCDSTPESEWAATKVAEMDFEENLKIRLLAAIARMDAVVEAKAAAEAADKIVEFDGVKYVKAW